MVSLHEMKNSDYGNAFGDSFDEYESMEPGQGLKYAVGRMGDKMQRIKNLAFSRSQKVKDESIKDTLIDLAAYAIMTAEAMELHSEREDLIQRAIDEMRGREGGLNL